MIHAYFTEGYYPWAEFFVKTLKHSNGEENRLILSSRNLDEKRIEALTKLYKNIEVRNKNLKYKEMAQRAKISQDVLLKYKNTVETIKVSDNSKVWKLMIAAEDRLKEIRGILDELNEGDIVLHLDIDTYIRRKVDPILNVIKENDFTTRWRIKKQLRRDGKVKFENRTTLISVQGYNINDKTKKFLDRWIHHLVKVPAHKRPLGYGQTSCYYAYLDLKDQLKWGDVPGPFLAPGGNAKNVILWGANKGSKKENLERYKEDFRRRVNGL